MMMSFVEYPKFKLSKRQADLAGRALINDKATPEEKVDAFEILENWRFNHIFPVHSYGDFLKKLLDDFSSVSEERPVLANRIKRLPSIYGKLKRFQEMKLSRMQDIGGLRVIFPALKDVYEFGRRLEESEMRLFKRRYDYIDKPKPSGYRSLHMVYEFCDESAPVEYHGINIEIQLRDKIQHYWATALETFSVFQGQALKEGGGAAESRRFFEVASACLAYFEGSPRHETFAEKTANDLALELYELNEKLNVFDKLESYRNMLGVTQQEKRTGEYVLLKLNSRQGKVDLHFFSRAELNEAYQAYADQERGNSGSDIVLVAVNSLDELLKAYPNYFANTSEFIALTKGFLQDNLA